MASYGEFITPPPLPAPKPEGTTCSKCGHPNCPTPGSCGGK